MAELSVSKAWDETRIIVARDNRLFAALALALVALPATITGLINPKGVTDNSTPLWVDMAVLAASLVALAGQLALIRMALGPATTVGDAVSHGLRRMPIYLLSAIIIGCGLLLAAVPFVLVVIAAGVQVDNEAELMRSPTFLFIALLYFFLLCFVGVRMLMSSPAASAERIGPIAIIQRSWELTRGHGWQLLGFVLLFFLAAVVVVIAIGAAVGIIVGLVIGPIEPMSVSALVVSLVQALVQAAVTTMLAVMLARMYTQLAGRADVEVSVPKSGI
ncbi:glycerophosphoryl diester phosphodiesterase membrane domain-containing protein [Sphingomonas hankyongi]|uniref:DUF7847 domain-containing protein n=1 Tax=Sphingomonas hankyongi TaxID=2908209 RepID=A0ABT0RYT1_9SPHN|nr:hypothetical protein [Sphingomonas hankyongi]MCL6728541.1 hypothetical protein [Sphingomonas hankyongi]